MKMQIFRISLFSFVVVGLLAGIFFTKEPVYDLSIERTILSESHDGRYAVDLDTPKNIWYLGIDKSRFADADRLDEVCALWETTTGSYRECIDEDGIDDKSEYFTFPVHTDLNRQIAFSLE